MSVDVIIAGLGAMGSAAAFHLAQRGLRVHGFDRFTPPHNFGSSHGESRIIREAYFEHPLYVPLVCRAYELWQTLAQSARQQLFLQTGGLMIGPPQGTLVSGARLSAHTHQLQHELLDAQTLRQRYPAFHVDDETVAVWEPRAGILFPEKCIAAHLQLAQQHGATLHGDEVVWSWQEEGAGLRVTTSKGQYLTSHLVLAAGAWLQTLLTDLHLPLQCTRQPLFWFEPTARAENFAATRLPIYIFEHEPNRLFYGFPNLGTGCKIAIHYEGEPTTAESIRRDVSANDVARVRMLLQRYLPDANGPLQNTAVCMYTNTTDAHFLLDFHPNNAHVLLVSPCSGHGFKFSSVIGELVAELLMQRTPRFDLTPFQLRRLLSH